MKARHLISIIGLVLLPLCAGAKELPCYDGVNPLICQFLNRYINELLAWNRTDASLEQKMRDDKFIVLEGILDIVATFDEQTTFSLVRYDDKAYEAAWDRNGRCLLRVAFPIQYELLLGMSQQEVEQHLQEYIVSASPRIDMEPMNMSVDSVAPGVWKTHYSDYYQVESLNTDCYFVHDTWGGLRYLDDPAHLDYAVSNLFQQGLGRDLVMQVSQSVYGFKHLHYTVGLQQWLDYCQQEGLTSFVAVEEESDTHLKVLVIARCNDLGYNHILSVLVPRDFLTNPRAILNAKVNAFIPTHNVANLYEQYTNKPKKQRQWED
ncbi:MAG: hypothetical protein IJ609_01050 [Paludibacteraceae bacterium]|nr:hypothetical protein [Paludibacteraceae bacterium]